MLLTDDLLLNHQRCRRRSFLDTYGDLTQRDPTNDYVLKLIQDSVAHQRSLLAGQVYHRPNYPSHDWQRGAEATLDLMRQGVEQIHQPVLLHQHPDGITLVSLPSLLVRQPGASNLGDWHYIPVGIKLGKRPKLEYQIIAAFQAYVLAAIQATWPDSSGLILRGKGYYSVNLERVLPEMQESLADCIQMLQSRQEPEVFISRSRCSLCHWYTHCYSIAQTDNHLSLVPGVTHSRYTHLQALQLTSLEALARSRPEKLENLPGFGPDVAEKLVRQAQSTLQNRPLLRPVDFNHPHDLATALPTAAVELYFDIEAEPELNLAYLHGILVVNRVTGEESFCPLIAETPEQEAQVWEQFLDVVWTYPDAPIFHFCPYEVQTVERLAHLYGTPKQHIQPLIRRFVDLHERVTRTVTLPVESYALKHIARWLGFNWRDANANGAQSIYWYSQWLATGDRAFLDLILRYNEDDCRATYYVKDWLVNFLHAELFIKEAGAISC